MSQAKLTPALVEKFVSLLKAGNYFETAAGVCGVHVDVARRWMRIGRNHEHKLATQDEPIPDDGKIYVAFVNAVGEAISAGEARLVTLISKAAEKDHKAALSLLERRHAKRWGPRVNVAVQEELNAFLDRLEQRLDAATYERVLEAGLEDDANEPASSGALGEAPH